MKRYERELAGGGGSLNCQGYKLRLCSEWRGNCDAVLMTLTKQDWREVRRILREKLDFEALRPGQREVL